MVLARARHAAARCGSDLIHRDGPRPAEYDVAMEGGSSVAHVHAPAIAAAMALAQASACGAPSAFECGAAQACDSEPGGMCEADGRCSYPDPSCASGRRYGTSTEGRSCVAEQGPRDASTVAVVDAEDGAAADAMADAMVVELPSRVTTGLVALYDFASSSGATVVDSSGVGAALDLTIDDPGAVSWTGDSLVVERAMIAISAGAATKIATACAASNELTAEAWITPANTTQLGPARIVAYSSGTVLRNFQIGAIADLYEGRLRTSTATPENQNGLPGIQTPAGDVVTELTHVVVSRATSGERRIFVDGVQRGADDPNGDFATSWNASYPLSIANETSLNRPWLGELHLVAVYCRELSADEVKQNFDAGHLAP